MGDVAVPGDNQVTQDFLATRALAQRPDPAKALDAMFGSSAAPPAMAAPMVPPVDPNQPVAQRVVQAAQTTTPAAPASFMAQLGQAASGGLRASLNDLGSSAEALAGKSAGGPRDDADYAKPLAWGDLVHPETALTKAVYQVAHGAPVLAAGVAGAGAGSMVGPEGTVAGGAIGAGAMTVAQELGPYYAAALKANSADPSKAFDQALARAGAAGAFSAAGWALFGLKPFTGVVKNLMFQAFGVQPAAAVAGKVADNAVTGAPLTQGAADAIPGAVVGTALPAIAHAAVGAMTGGGEAAPPGAETQAAAPVTDAAASGGLVAPEQSPAVEPVKPPFDLMANPAHDAAAELIQIGKDTGVEHLRAYNVATNEIEHEAEGQRSRVEVPDELHAAMSDPANSIIVQHNHPGSTALSPADLTTLSNFPGLAAVVAHGHDGTFSAAMLKDGQPIDPNDIKSVEKDLTQGFSQAARDGTLNYNDANKFFADARNRVLNYGGKIDYVSSFDPPPAVQSIITDTARKLYGDQGPDADGGLSVAVRPDEGLAGVLERVRGLAGQNAYGADGAGASAPSGSGPAGGSAAGPGLTGLEAASPTASGAAAQAVPIGDAATAPPKDGAPPVPEPAPEAIPLGDKTAPPIEASPDVEKMADAFLKGESGDNPIKVNLAYIGGGADIEDVLSRVSSMLPAQAVQSHEATTALALQLGSSPDDFLKGYGGTQPDAARLTAMRFVLNSTADQLGQLAKLAMDPTTGTPEAKAVAIRAFAQQTALQQYFENARAEAGRTLNAFQIMSRQFTGSKAQAVADLIKNFGGQVETDKLLQMIADINDPALIPPLVNKARQMTARDLFMYGYYNVILSNIPHVLAKKLTSDVTAATWELGVRALAARMPGAEVQPGEAMQMLYGYASAMRDGLRLAGQGLLTGEHQFEGATSLDAISPNRVQQAAAGAPTDIPPDQPTRAAVDYLKMALPTRWIGAADDFAKYVNYRAELNGLAFRSGVQKGLSGDDLENHISTTLATVPSDMHQQAVSAAMQTTFQDPLTGVAKALESTADAINIPLPGTDFAIPFGRMVLPFVKIPANLVGWTYRNSPIAAAFPSQQIKAALAGGGAARDLALARMTLGSGVALAAGGLAVNGLITGRGPSDPGMNRAWRAAGNQPYSITIGGRPYGYNQVDPIGMYLGAIGDTFDTLRFAPEQSRYDIAASLGFGLGNALLSKTYMSGLSQFFDALQSPDKEGSKYVDRFLGNLAAPGAVAGVQTATDPWLRAHYSLLDAVQARTPGLSGDLPPDRNLWGDPIPKQAGFLPGLSGTGVARAISPVTYGAPAADAEPIDKWIWDNRAAFPHSDTGQLDLSKPAQVQSFSAGRGINVQLQLTPQQLDRYQEQAGNGLKEPSTGLGAKDYLNALVKGTNPDAGVQKQWDDADSSMRALIVQRVASGLRNAAKKQLMTDFPDLADAVRIGAQARAQQLTGANGVRPGGANP
jgi:hypothetical protein